MKVAAEMAKVTEAIDSLRTVVDETLAEMGRPVSGPSKKVAVCAVIRNPYAGRCAPG